MLLGFLRHALLLVLDDVVISNCLRACCSLTRCISCTEPKWLEHSIRRNQRNSWPCTLFGWEMDGAQIPEHYQCMGIDGPELLGGSQPVVNRGAQTTHELEKLTEKMIRQYS